MSPFVHHEQKIKCHTASEEPGKNWYNASKLMSNPKKIEENLEI
jgi:hypothetical protein